MKRPLELVELVELAQRLNAASAADDWSALAAIDRDLAAALPRSAGRGPGTAGERAAWTSLRQAHRSAQQRCGRESALLGERLSALRTNKEGWLAYAVQEHREGSAS
ncbi:MAG TPA: hypothetical protein VGM74_08705 [Burkholderiaceae bacterium]|jgi:hypothetical protein